MFAIDEGPFAGTKFEFQEAVKSIVGMDQVEKAAILLPALNQAFLKHYDPKAGWAVIIEGELARIDMPPLVSESASNQPVPCAMFNAKLVSPEGRTMATASTLWTIVGPTSWEKGETNARIRLYEASGLQARFELPPAGVQLPVAASSAAAGSQLQEKSAGARQTKSPKILEFRPFLEKKPDQENLKEADTAPVVVNEEKQQVTSDVQKLTSQAQVAETVVTEAVETVSQLPAQVAPITTARRGRVKRRELDPDAPASPELRDRCKVLAALKFKAVPELKTTGDALKFLASLE